MVSIVETRQIPSQQDSQERTNVNNGETAKGNSTEKLIQLPGQVNVANSQHSDSLQSIETVNVMRKLCLDMFQAAPNILSDQTLKQSDDRKDQRFPSDGPSSALLDFIGSYGNVAPDGWPGYREFSFGEMD